MKPTTLALSVVGTMAAGLLAYAVYFDHRRRNDPSFRRQLRKSRKKTMKSQARQAEQEVKDTASLVVEALKLADAGPPAPVNPAAREAYFMEQVSLGESLIPAGSSAVADAAAAFFSALRVYPNPMEMVMIYQKTIPEAIFRVVMGMMSFEMQQKQEKYYEIFPPADMRVKLQKHLTNVTTADGTKVFRQVLGARTPITAGETLYSEKPVVVALEPSLEGAAFCHHCLTAIPTDSPTAIPCSSCSTARFCSTRCHVDADSAYHAILCPGKGEDASASSAIAAIAAETGTKVSSMIAKLFTTAVSEERRRMAEEEEAEEYGVWEHLERLRYLEIRGGPREEEERLAIIAILSTKVPGMEEFVNEERYLTLKGRLLYNFYAIHLPPTADALPLEPASEEQPREDDPATRIGAGLYTFTSYATHSCEPNCEVRFPEGGSALSLIARRDLAEGEDIRVSFVRPSLPRKVRRELLAKHWRIDCQCPRCVREEAEEKEKEEGEMSTSDVKDTTSEEAEINAATDKDEITELAEKAEINEEAQEAFSLETTEDRAEVVAAAVAEAEEQAEEIKEQVEVIQIATSEVEAVLEAAIRAAELAAGSEEEDIIEESEETETETEEILEEILEEEHEGNVSVATDDFVHA